MINNSYLVPANAKKGTLILNVFRLFDIVMFSSGILLTLLLITIVSSNNLILMLLCCLPAAITGFLVIPIPNYHNVLVAIQSIFNYYFNRKCYVWKGWCFYERFVNEQQSNKG